MRMLIENMASCLEPALPVVNEETAKLAAEARANKGVEANRMRQAEARAAAIAEQEKLIREMEEDDEEAEGVSEKERNERILRNQERLAQIKKYKDAEKKNLNDKERLLFEAEERKREFRASLSKATLKGMESGGMQWIEEQLEERGMDSVTGSTNEVVKRLDMILREETLTLRENMEKLRNEQYARDKEEKERADKAKVITDSINKDGTIHVPEHCSLAEALEHISPYILCSDKRCSTNLSVGTKICAKFSSGGVSLFYPGEILVIRNDGMYDVLFDDGDTGNAIPLDQIKIRWKFGEEAITTILLSKSKRLLGNVNFLALHLVMRKLKC